MKELITSQMADTMHVWKDKWEMASLEWPVRKVFLNSGKTKNHFPPQSPCPKELKNKARMVHLPRKKGNGAPKP